jgi:small subunit ribosomal protein S21e
LRPFQAATATHRTSAAKDSSIESADPLLLLPSCCCSAWTNKLITAKDHASVQLNIGHLNEEGIYQNHFTTFALAGKVRAQVSAGQAVGWVVFGCF